VENVSEVKGAEKELGWVTDNKGLIYSLEKKWREKNSAPGTEKRLDVKTVIYIDVGN
jgi:hypothetical protein